MTAELIQLCLTKN